MLNGRCFAVRSCLKDHSMFKKKKEMVNQANGYENLTDSEDERGKQSYPPESPSGIPEDAPITVDT